MVTAKPSFRVVVLNRVRQAVGLPIGPEPATFYPGLGMDAGFLHDVNQALRLTIQADGWPDTYGRYQPVVETGPNDGAATSVPADQADPFRLSKQHRVTVMIGEHFFETPLPQQLLPDGFSQQQILVQALLHEAYHSNEGQHLQRCRVPFDLFAVPFVAGLREQFPKAVGTAIFSMSRIMQPYHRKMKAGRLLDHEIPIYKSLQNLHTKIDEGAADVYSMVRFRRLYPNDTHRYLVALARGRRQERSRSELEETPIVAAQAYDNASCLEALIHTPKEHWPENQFFCTIFSLQQAIPFLRQEPLFAPLSQEIERMALCLSTLVQPKVHEALVLDETFSLKKRVESRLKNRHRSPPG